MLVVGGESLIDLVQEPLRPDGVIEMTAHQGGSPYNCAIALSKLGNDTGFLCPISKDGFGTYLLGPLQEAGVKSLLPERVFAPSTLAVVTLNARKEAQYEFYRGADRAFTREGLIAALPPKLDVVQFGGFCLNEPQDAEIWIDVVKAALARGATVTIDPNVRPSLINDFPAFVRQLDQALDLVHLVKVSIEDLMTIDRQQPVKELPGPEQEAVVAKYVENFLSRPNCELVVVTFGEGGSRAFTRAGRAEADIYSPPVFGDTVGAGDSLMAGILTILGEQGHLQPGRLRRLDQAALEKVLRFGAVVAGLNCAHKGCVPPTRGEVDAVLGATV